MDAFAIDNLYDEIARRKSVRRYKSASAPDELITELLAFMNALTPMSPDTKLAFAVLGAREVRGSGAKMPYYLVCYASGPKHLLDAGCAVQYADLWLSARGYGRCWLGMAKPTADKRMHDGLPHVTTLGFGEPDEPVYRETIAEFERKPMAAITDITGRDALLEPVRLAPSAMNGQPWFVMGGDPFVVALDRPGGLKGMLLGDLVQLDIGIAACHLILALRHEGKAPTVSFSAVPVLKGCEYMLTISA